MKDEYNLTPKQRLFCERYLSNGFNASEAVRYAYPDNNKNDTNWAYRLVQKPVIRKYIQDSITNMASDLRITAELILKELQTVAFDKDTPAKDKLKALDLIQKQMGLQNQKLTLQSNDDLIFNVNLTDYNIDDNDTENDNNNEDSNNDKC